MVSPRPIEKMTCRLAARGHFLFSELSSTRMNKHFQELSAYLKKRNHHGVGAYRQRRAE